MTLAALVARYLGSPVNSVYGIGGECTDWCNVYLGLVRGIPHVYRDAVNWREPIPGLAWTANTPTNSPPSGAVVVWGSTPSEGIGQAGHVAVAVLADAEHIVSLDQNWQGRYLHFVVHPYSGVLGWQS